MTLIELLVVVVVLAILSVIAVPSYQDYVMRARRADARAALLELSQFMERYYTENSRYSRPNGTAPTLPFTEAPKDGTDKYYDLSVTSVAQNSYQLRAAPKGPQASDRCGALSLTHTGGKGATGSAGASECWSR